jgi:hypothetical protein
MTMIHTQHFTLEEAGTLLEELKPVIMLMVKLKQELDAKGYDIYSHQYFGGLGSNGTGTFPKEMDEFVSAVKIITTKGILIKGIDEGLIDFPHIRENGDEVYLCWKVGEDKIEYWHDIADGFAGRKRIEEL